MRRKGIFNSGRAAAGGLALFALCAGCSGGGDILASRPEPAPAPPQAEPAPPAPPPIDIAGRWRLAAAAGGACFMTFGVISSAAGSAAAQGTIAPEGGCPGNFFTSRKWTFEDGALIIRDFKGEPLARLSYEGDHFAGQDASGALTLSK